MASEGCGLADLAPTLRQKESDSQTERREEEEDGMRGEKKSRTEENGMKMRSDKVTDGSPDSEHNRVSLQRLKSQRSIRYSSNWSSETQQRDSSLPLGQIPKLVESLNVR